MPTTLSRLAAVPFRLVAIGLCAVAAQLLPGQVADAAVGSVTGAEKVGCRRRFQELLIAVPTRDLDEGWRLARDLGRPVAPLLWEMVRQERSNVDRRLVLLAAALIAGGQGEDERLFEWLGQPRPMLEERVLAAFQLAMGPRRSRGVAGFWPRLLGPAKTPEQLLAIAARLAAARFPGVLADAPGSQANDPGLLAATAFAGLPVSQAQLARMGRGEERHVSLFWRGVMLGDAWRMADSGQEPASLEHAAELLLRRERPGPEELAAAMLLAARAGRLDANSPPPDFALLRVAGGEAASRGELQTWLSASPKARDEQPERLAVCYAWVVPIDEVIAAIPTWSQDARIRRHVALTLALRLATGAQPRQQLPVELPAVAEWAFCVWAAGGRFTPGASFDDPRLAAIAELLVAERCGKEAFRGAIEEVLWRWGCHPGFEAYALERRLIRDLLLAGSKWGGGRYQPHLRAEQLYFPTGLDRSNEFFHTAVALYEFLMRPVGPVPQEHRLR